MAFRSKKYGEVRKSISLDKLSKKIPRSYYQTTDVVGLAMDLIGKEIHTIFSGIHCSAIISETEAYAGEIDRASHAYGGRKTKRTRIMYEAGGVSYVYLCYGIHHLFNVVTGPEEIPHAILIRGIIPKSGIGTMEDRRNKKRSQKGFSSGPGTLTTALGIRTTHSNLDLCSEIIWLEEANFNVKSSEIKIGPRIGIDYAGEDALLPYRFLWNAK